MYDTRSVTTLQRRKPVLLISALTMLALAGCGGTSSESSPTGGITRAVGTCFINMTSNAQTMEGIGGATAWLGRLSTA